MRFLSSEDVADLQHAHYDIVIVGAGMVGLTLALGLAERFDRILIVEAFKVKPHERPQTRSFDERSTALSWGSVDVLQRLGVWGKCQNAAAQITEVHVSEQGRFGVTRLSGHDSPSGSLGYVLPNQSLGAALMSSLRGGNVDLLSPASIKKTAFSAKSINLEIQLADGVLACNAKLLLIADGSCSQTAERLGIATRVQEYGQHAIICNVETSMANSGVAYERFTPAGPMAMLPLSDYRSALVWTLPTDQAEKIAALSDVDFLQRLQRSFGDRLGCLTKSSARHVYPLRLTQIEERSRRGCFVLGNAAHSLHPVAGQGFNLALRGVVHLISGLFRAKAAGSYLGDPAMLAEISAGLERDVWQTVQFSDKLISGFAESSLLAGVVRDGGLIALNNLPVLRHWFTRQSMGLGHAVPTNTLGEA
ncbi:MAG: 2-octaprenyl-6-methoxyphenyl hydroxylase [Oleiphilaceae bacterium]|nr:2-octaprenyl-6-methoxyphenyl hydroxylase [Oleiphilaceae bacterium]